jgi:Flp pilus assembly pilin Flp
MKTICPVNQVIRTTRECTRRANEALLALWCRATFPLARMKRCLASGVRDERGQGTTEYAILVGVLVVMAILAIALFRPRLQELWNSIAEGINGL